MPFSVTPLSECSCGGSLWVCSKTLLTFRAGMWMSLCVTGHVVLPHDDVGTVDNNSHFKQIISQSCSGQKE